MTKKFDKQMQDRFMRDLQHVEIGSDSELDDSIGDSYYESQKKVIEEAMNAMKNKTNNKILEEVKKDREIEDAYCDQFQDEVAQLQSIVRNNDKNVFKASTLEEIKQKVFNQSKMHSLVLADEMIEKSVKEQKIKEKKVKQAVKSFSKKTEEVDPMTLKLEKARSERQSLAMEQEDEFSKKRELSQLSNFFSERFTEPKLINPKQKAKKVKLHSATPEQTFTNKRPLPNTEQNVFSKNSPQVALRRINKTKKIKLLPSSVSKATVKIKKLPEVNPEQKTLVQQIAQKQNKEIQMPLSEYFEKLKPVSEAMETMSKKYSPKFINEFSNQNQTSLIDVNEGKVKSLSDCLEVMDQLKLTDITFAFENIATTSGVSKYPNIEQIGLQYNRLSDLNEVDSCKKLIQLNVSHNKIKSIQALKNLQYLRVLNIEYNMISEIQLNGASLEYLYAGHNRIQQIICLGSNQHLKKLIINENNLQSLKNLNKHPTQKLYQLEEINVSKNYLKNLDGLEDCIMLRILDASRNRLDCIFTNNRHFVFIFLNKLTLSDNSLTTLNSLFLPSLYELYLNKNKIQSKSDGVIYLPELKTLNLDENKLAGFNSVYSFIHFSKSLETLKYDKNLYFMEIREKVRELYEFIVYANMSNLNILNQGAYDIGMKKYYEGAYSRYLSSNSALKSYSQKLKQIHKKLMFNIRENKFIGELQQRKHKFSQKDIFIEYKYKKKIEDLREIVEFNEKGNEHRIVLKASNTLFYSYDQYSKKIRRSVHKIQSLFILFKYKQNKRRQYFIKNKDKLSNLFGGLDQYAFKICLLGCIRAFQAPLNAKNTKQKEEAAAIMIQKTFRMYRIRKRFLKILKKLRKTEQDQEFPEIDLNEFDEYETFELDLQIPDEYNFEEYIIRPQIFEALQKKENERNLKINQSLVQEKKEERGKMVNNFVQGNASAVSRGSREQHQQNSYQEQITKIMRNWSITRQAAQAYYLKQKKKQKLKKLESDKHLSASERYSRFKNNGR